MVIRSLAFIELTSRHSSENLKAEINKILELYSATEEPNNAHPQDSDNISSDDDFENFVQLRTSSTTEVSEEQVSIKEKVLQKQLEQKVRQLGSQKKISMKADIFEHYEHLLQSKAIDKDSYQLAMVVLSAPATQVSVERSFSALAIVMDPLRISMKGELIDDILVCALNKVLLDLVGPPRLRHAVKLISFHCL